MEIYFYLGVLQIEEEISLWLGLWLLGRLGACMQERREMREATEEEKTHGEPARVGERKVKRYVTSLKGSSVGSFYVFHFTKNEIWEIDIPHTENT